MTEVQIHLALPTGEPVADATIEIQMLRTSFNDDDTGVLMPRLVTAVTDENGDATVELWPSPMMYYLTVPDTISEAGIFYKFIVPVSDGGLPMRLQDIVIVGEMSNVTYDEAALLVIQDAKANALASAVASAASATAAAGSATAAAASAASAAGEVDGLASDVADLAAQISGGTMAIDGLPADGSGTDAGPAFNAVTNVGGTAAVARRTKVAMPVGKAVFSNRIDLDPQVSWTNGARGNSVIKAVANMPAVTEGLPYNNGANPTGTGGAPNSVIRLRRNSPVVEGSLSYFPEISGLYVDGNKGNQVNEVHGLRVPNSKPANNTYDPDPNYTSNKDNRAPRVKNSNFNNCSGNGIDIEAGNGSFYAEDVQTIGNLGIGIMCGGNDPIIGQRVGSGSNWKHALQFGNISGGMAPGGANIWGGPNRQLTAVGVFYNNTSGGAFNNNVLQDTIRLSPKENRGVHVGGNLMVPLESVFTGPTEGLPLDVSASGDQRLRCWVSVEGASLNSFLSTNIYARTSPVAYATAGQGDGTYGDAFPYILNVMGASEHGAILNFTSHPLAKPYTTTDALPVNVQGGWAMGLAIDQHRGMVRNYAIGVANTTNGDSYGAYFMWGSNRAKDYGNGYLGEIGETDKRTLFYGASEFNSGVQYTSAAFDGRVMTDGLVRTIKVGDRLQRVSVAGGGIASGGFVLPTDLLASQQLDIIITGGPIAALSWSFSGAGTLFATSPPLPTATGGFLYVSLWFDHTLNRWFVQQAIGDRGVVGRRDGSAPQAGVIGEHLVSNVNSAAAGALVSTTPSNITSLTLPAGEYDVWATQVYVGNAAVPVRVKGGISETSGAITATAADAYAIRSLNLGAAVTGDFETLRIGPVRVSVATSTTLYNVARSDFTGTGVSVFGNLKARRVG